MLEEILVERKEVIAVIMDQQRLGSTDVHSNSLKDIKPIICEQCNLPILDRYLNKIYEKCYHENCLRCYHCQSILSNTCFVKDDTYYCKRDYKRLFGCVCSGCSQVISPTELVMKALQYIYHIDCFKCHECGDKLEKGDEFLLKDDKLYCSADFNVAEQRSDTDMFSSDDSETMSTTSPKDLDDKNSGCKRPRTILTSQQREDFKAAFELTPKPCRKVREQLSNETGLSVRVVQVWFQNQRAKLKKLQRKAEEGGNADKIKKNNSNGKVRKKKPTKANFTLKEMGDVTEDTLNSLSNETAPTNDVNSFANLLTINENFGSANNSLANLSTMSYYTQINQGLLNENRNLTNVNNFPVPRAALGQFGRIPTLLETNVALSPLQTANNTTFQVPPLTSVASPIVSTNFQLMPHLMNSYI